MSQIPDQLCSYTYQYYGRSVYTQQLIRGHSLALFTTIISPSDPKQACTLLASTARGQTVIRHEYTPSRFGSCPDVLFIICSEPCTVICNEDLVSFSSQHSATFTTTQPAFYGTRIVPLPSLDTPGEDPSSSDSVCGLAEPYGGPTSPDIRRQSPGTLFPPGRITFTTSATRHASA